MREIVQDALSQMKTQKGESLADLVLDQPVLLVFLRHFGCIFCMEAMRDIAENKSVIESRGVKICFVHMASHEVAESYFNDYNVSGLDHVSDPDCNYYDQFGLIKGNFGQLFGLQVWLRTAQLAVKDLSQLRRKQIGDGLQMPGVFLLHKDEILSQFVHGKASDRPDYLALTDVLVQK